MILIVIQWDISENMMTSSNENIFCVTGLFVRGIHRFPVNSLHKGQCRGALMFSLICIWIYGWVSTREAGDLRRYRTHYHVTVMNGLKDGLKWEVVSHEGSWWRHQMETFPRYWPFVRGIHRSPVNSPHKGQCRGALMFSLICVWTNGWVNIRNCIFYIQQSWMKQYIQVREWSHKKFPEMSE